MTNYDEQIKEWERNAQAIQKEIKRLKAEVDATLERAKKSYVELFVNKN